MKKLLLMLVAMQFCVGCIYSGKTEKATVELAPFTTLNVGSAFEVELVQDTVHRMHIEVDADWFDRVQHEVKNGELRVWVEPRIKRRPYTMKLRIHVKRIDAIESDSAVKLTNKGVFNADSLLMRFDGASSINLNIQARTLHLFAAGASSVELQGNAAVANVKLDGAASYSGYKMAIDSMTLSTDGGTSSKVNAINYLKIDADGIAKITYMGNPTLVKNSSGLVVIERR